MSVWRVTAAALGAVGGLAAFLGAIAGSLLLGPLNPTACSSAVDADRVLDIADACENRLGITAGGLVADLWFPVTMGMIAGLAIFGADAARRHARTLLTRLSQEVGTREHERRGGCVSNPRDIGGTMERRQHDRLTKPGRRHSDHRPAAADHRRVLLVGPDEAWRLLTAYVFEEAGYVVYAAADEPQAVAFASRLLPDVVVVHMEMPPTLNVLARLAEAPSTCDIPVVVLTTSLHSADANRARAAGGVTLLPHTADVEVLIGEVDTLIAVAARARRTLRRRLLDLQELAKYYTPDAEGQARLRNLIDHLQVAIFAVDAQGQCIAASEGATMLTGYSRSQLLTTAAFQTAFACGDDFLVDRQYGGTATITTQEGEDVLVHAAAMAEIMPGFHVAAFLAA